MPAYVTTDVTIDKLQKRYLSLLEVEKKYWLSNEW